MADKFVALERDKAELCYQLCRALRAKRVVEAGTSYGVSTLYLAAAVRDNLRDDGGSGSRDRHRARAREGQDRARALRAEAGLADLIELREGDLRETLKDVGGPIDFMLIDIWTPMARPGARAGRAARCGPARSPSPTTPSQFREALRRLLRVRERSRATGSARSPCRTRAGSS